MKKQSLIDSVLLTSLLLLVSCSSVRSLDRTAQPAVTGKWHGEIYKPEYGYLFEWEHDVRPDGTYLDTFNRVYPDGKKEKRTESGKWWVEGQKYFEIIPGMEKPDEYRILMLSDRYFVIQVKSVDRSTLAPGIGAIYVHKK